MDDLVIPIDGRPIEERTRSVDSGALETRSTHELRVRSIGAFIVRGKVVDLSDDEFGAKNR